MNLNLKDLLLLTKPYKITIEYQENDELLSEIINNGGITLGRVLDDCYYKLNSVDVATDDYGNENINITLEKL